MNECEIIQSEIFKKWLSKVKEGMAVMRIGAGIRRMSVGNFGNCKPVRAGISELRIDHGPGYRVLHAQRSNSDRVLAGGDKSTQDADIERAIAIAKEWKE